MKRPPPVRQLATFASLSLLLMTLVFVFSSPAMGQATTGTLKGSVVDPNGQAVTGASVTAKSDATGVEKNTVTGDDGLYSISELIPGKYTIMVAPLPGFTGKTVTAAAFRLAEVTSLKIDMVVGTPPAN